jgi:hypothetical protein
MRKRTVSGLSGRKCHRLGEFLVRVEFELITVGTIARRRPDVTLPAPRNVPRARGHRQEEHAYRSTLEHITESPARRTNRRNLQPRRDAEHGVKLG